MCTKDGDMKLPYYLLLAAAATPAFAQTAAPKSSLNYNRIAAGYTSDDILKGYNVTGSALLGDAIIVSGIYEDVKTKGEAFGSPISGLSGKLSGFGLAYKFNVGPGDLAVGYFYKTGTVYGNLDVDAGESYTVASAEQKGFGLKYRQAINSSLELSVGYTRLSTKLGFVTMVPYSSYYYADAAELDETANVWNVGARYNFTKNIDLSIEYAFKNQKAGGDKFGVSAGYNF